jgi:hypothetical protein
MNRGEREREMIALALGAAGVGASEVQNVEASLEDVFIERVADDGSVAGTRP